MTGDWSLLFKTLSDQTTLGRDIGRVNLRPAAEIVAARAREKLGVYQGAVGRFPAWKPLAEDTISHKKMGDSPLLETGQMQKDITVGDTVVIDRNRHATITVGIPADAESARYAYVMEMGSRDQEKVGAIPARPFLGPALYEVKQMVRDEIKAQIRATL